MSDADLTFHKSWLGMVQPSEGLVVSIPVLIDAQVGHKLPLSFHESFRASLERIEGMTPDAEPQYRVKEVESFLQTLLEWPATQLHRAAELPEDLSLYVPEGSEKLTATFGLKRMGEVSALGETPSAKAGSAYLALVSELPDGTSLDKPDARLNFWSYPSAAKFDRLLREVRVPIGLITNRREFRLIYAPHGEASGSITFRLDDMVQVGGRAIVDAFFGLLNGFRFFGAANEHQLPSILAESRKRQINVTNQLAEQVFEALQILLGGFEAAAERDSHYRQLFEESVRREDDHVYSGLLTVLLRLVFALYAEDRGLLPVEHAFYSEHLSLLSLFADLTQDHGAFPDSMSRRFGAWPRLVSLFRAIFLGCQYDDLTMPQRRGELFDPHLFPFLEGWGPGGSAPINLGSERAAVAVPAVDDFTIFQVLQRLLLLDGQRLSYRTLDVEQIGSVYEALMGYHVVQAKSPAVCLPGRKIKRIWIEAADILETPAPQRHAWVATQLGYPKPTKVGEGLGNAETAEQAIATLDRWKVKHSQVVKPGGYYLQPGDERKRTSSHYTPRSLSAPIVATTLEPLMRAMGEVPSSERLLNLKICDPAMGSGAFLVEACRYLGDRLVAAWTREGKLKQVVEDHGPGEVTNHARRLVAQRCLYGVDKNKFAVNLAKLSMWLVTLAKDEPFTFMDHALRNGDSLVGLDFEQIKAFHWKPQKQLELCRGALEGALKDAVALRTKILNLAASGDAASTKEKYRLLQDADDALKPARLIGDLVVGAFFSAKTDKDREKERFRRLQLVEKWLASDASPPDELLQMQAEIQARLPVFHWMTEFPEVFFAERLDPLDENQVNRAAYMDAFLGNPPFLGGSAISSNFGDAYLAWLLQLHDEAHGNGDLCAHFFRRADSLLGQFGTMGFISTNTISQGDTQQTGLLPLHKKGLRIYSAVKSMAWPGEAAVSISTVHIAKGLSDIILSASGFFFNTQLELTIERNKPQSLRSNEGCAFLGVKVYGKGFELTPEDRANLIKCDKKNAERIFPYLGGEEVNTSPTQAFHRYVINFGQMELPEAEKWPDIISIVRAKVKPERDTNNRDNYRLRWWQFGERRPGLYAAIRPLKRCLVNSQVSKHLIFAFQPTDRIFAHTLNAYALPDWSGFATLQSRVHESWARLLSSTMEDRLRYAASDCFDTYPFPKPDPKSILPALESIGENLYERRARYMLESEVGLTITYNRLKDPNCTDPIIEHLRALHVEMDSAVLDAYGWSDIEVPPFSAPENNLESEGLKKFKSQVIDRLFALNLLRAKEDALLGGGKATKSIRKKRASKN